MAKRISKQASAPTKAARPTSRKLPAPIFSELHPTEDPTTFKFKHRSDSDAYHAIDELNKTHKLEPMPFPTPRSGGQEPRLTLSQVFGNNELAKQSVETIVVSNKQIVFHALGDCGSTRGPKSQNEVVDKMIGDFNESHSMELPQFALLLGDIVYSFGEPEYYYDQFYEPYRNYHAPVLAAAGNHDGMISPLAHATSLQAYLNNFCADPANGYVVTAEAGGLSRTAQIQPGVFFTFEAPFVRILVFYSNTLEDPGVIADPKKKYSTKIGVAQLEFIRAALKRIAKENYAGALLFAHHHPPYAVGGQHSSSSEMRQQMDAICAEVGVWPHAVLAGHAHSYQRFTRHRKEDNTEIPYVICGNGGHNHQKLHAPDGIPLRVPQILNPKTPSDDEVTFENYDDDGYGYLRVIVDQKQLRIEYHSSSDTIHSKTPSDSVTIELSSHKRMPYQANDLGYPARAALVRKKLAAQQSARNSSKGTK